MHSGNKLFKKLKTVCVDHFSLCATRHLTNTAQIRKGHLGSQLEDVVQHGGEVMATGA